MAQKQSVLVVDADANNITINDGLVNPNIGVLLAQFKGLCGAAGLRKN